jgi:predicted PolB exonuclease-like 3'-5' exonuclease
VALHEIAMLSGIPGKFETAGEQVAQMWLDGQWLEIVRYNCFDALTTYLVWLRMAHLAGHVSDEGYEEEQQTLNDRLLELAEKPETEFLNRYIEEWERLQAAR